MGEYMELIKSEYDEQLQKMKSSGKAAVAQKIPNYVKAFTRNDLK